MVLFWLSLKWGFRWLLLCIWKNNFKLDKSTFLYDIILLKFFNGLEKIFYFKNHENSIFAKISSIFETHVICTNLLNYKRLPQYEFTTSLPEHCRQKYDFPWLPWNQWDDWFKQVSHKEDCLMATSFQYEPSLTQSFYCSINGWFDTRRIL